MKRLWKVLPWAFFLLFATEIVVVMLPKKDGQFAVSEFGRLPVLLNGRIQPLDSVARNSLLQIRSTGDVPLEQVPSWKFWHHPKKLKSTEWLLEVFFKPELADTRPIFLIHHPDLISELKLGDKGVEPIIGLLYIDSLVRNFTYAPEQLRLLTAIGLQAGMAIQNFKLYQSQLKAERLAKACAPPSIRRTRRWTWPPTNS